MPWHNACAACQCMLHTGRGAGGGGGGEAVGRMESTIRQVHKYGVKIYACQYMLHPTDLPDHRCCGSCYCCDWPADTQMVIFLPRPECERRKLFASRSALEALVSVCQQASHINSSATTCLQHGIVGCYRLKQSSKTPACIPLQHVTMPKTNPPRQHVIATVRT